MLRGIGKHTILASRVGAKSFSNNASTMAMNGITGNSTTLSTDYNILDGLLQFENQSVVRRLYKDIYYHDVIAGGAVDMQATLPFSDFTLSGVNDPSILSKYHESVENVAATTYLPTAVRDHLVTGANIAALHFNSSEKIYESIIPLNIDMCEITPAPVFNMDPLINIKFGADSKTYIREDDRRLESFRKKMPDWMIEGIKAGKVLLDPNSVIYIPRKTFSTSSLGTSYFRRILPIHLLEKALLRGSIDQAYKRQRAIGLLTVGDEEWEPTNEELTNYSNLILQASLDPVGAVVAMRQGVNYQDIRRGDDMWKYDDIFEFAASAKLRGLGMSESMLSGEYNFSSLDQAMTFFIEQMKTIRNEFTKEFFYNRLFPNIAIANNHVKSDRYTVTSSYKEDDAGNYSVVVGNRKHSTLSSALGKNFDPSRYQMPSIHWHKALQPQGDQLYLDMLKELSGLGFPIPLRMMAAAAGASPDEIISGYKDDVKLRETISDYNDQIKDFVQPDDSNMALASASPYGSVKPVGLINRKIDSEDPRYRMYAKDGKGKRVTLSKKRQKEINETVDRVIATLAAEKAEKELKKSNDIVRDNRKRNHYHSR